MIRESFRVEIVRPGPLHGQLLSRLTNYIALCDGVEADTLRLPFDHYEITDDLEALRYTVGDKRLPVQNPLRLAAVERLSQRLAGVLDQMRGFQTRLAEAAESELAHLRLVLGGGELSLIPFELAYRPAGWPGSGGNLSLQCRPCVVVTREHRDSSRLPLRWNRHPRILVCAASPDGFAPPPTEAHLVAICQAVQPSVDAGRHAGKDLHIRDVVTLLENASLNDIAAATEKSEYTHVHFICHGVSLDDRAKRYGLALARPGKPSAVEKVDAFQLARAVRGLSGTLRPPTMVTLASCDSANQDTIETPGSSLAYELHRHGIPWVVASQMPLTYPGSATLARVLYRDLFKGDDPVLVLASLRAELARDHDAHDWAAVAVYAAFPDDFNAQCRAFQIRQIRAHIDAALQRVERDKDDKALRGREFETVNACIKRWGEIVQAKKPSPDPDEVSEYEGTLGAVAKQRAELSDDVQGSRRSGLSEARAHYLKAANARVGNHWVVVQYLALSRALRLDPGRGWVELAERGAAAAMERGGDDATWAVGTLLELAILNAEDRALDQSSEHWAKMFCRDATSFMLFSTVRQITRYVEGILKPALENVPGAIERATAILQILKHAATELQASE